MHWLKKLWDFIWHDDSALSWIVNIVLALVLVKFVIYPGLGLIFMTSHPLVAVVSGSMEHNNFEFDDWWSQKGSWYIDNGISKEGFRDFSFKNGFSKGDIMVLRGSKELKVGDVVVFNRDGNSPPIIHRLVKTNSFLQTKGDNNNAIHDFESNIPKENIIGKAVLRIPYLGYVKILFVDLIWNPIKSVL
ncbi:MAG: signal peptidase I [Candidatus Woesearchaeota archaeon]